MRPHLKRSLPLLILCLVLTLSPWTWASSDAPEVAEGATEHMVEMRDGVKLATNVFLPEGEGPWPVVLTRTPYGKDRGRFPQMSKRYTAAGYAFIAQDCRGKFRSQGAYVPFQRGLQDGYDTVEWVATQDFSNGKVGMTGASAMGITANLAAASDPPHLVAAFVVVAPQTLFDQATFINGVFKEADVGNWMRGQGAGDQVAATKARVLLSERWKAEDLIHHLNKIDIPIYNVGGWYDIFGQGNLDNFTYLQNLGRKGAHGRQKLLMGPFGHGQLDGELSYGSQGILQAFAQELRWFDHWLKGTENGIMDEPPVKFYLMASARGEAPSKKNGYRTAENWPLKHQEVRFHLAPNGGLTLQPPRAKGESTTSYRHDPAAPIPTVGGANLTLPLGPKDQREIEPRADYLRFQTEPLAEDLTVVGPIQLDLWAETTAPDTDFMVKLVDVYPDGYEALLLDAPLRTRYRHGRRPEDVQMMIPGEAVRMTVNLWSTANVFEAGHRLAVHIASSNYPRFEINPGTGEAPGRSEIEPRPAVNAIHHDTAHPTALVIPVVENGKL